MTAALKLHPPGADMANDKKNPEHQYPDPDDEAMATPRMRTVDGPGAPYATSRKKSALDKLLEQSGLSARRFARLILAARGERTFRRWQEEGAPAEVEEWAAEDVVRLERRGHLLHLVIRAPLNARDDRRSAAGENE